MKSDGASRRFKRKYEGAFENDKMHGFGVLNQRDGSKYEGVFENDKKHGVGKILQCDGSSRGLGRWENGKFVRLLHHTVPVHDPQQAHPACTICRERPVDTIVFPCKHMHFCSICIDEWRNRRGNHSCPYCRINITDTHQVFLP